MSKKISELEKCKKINEDSSLPILCEGETMQLLYKTLIEDLKKIFSEFSGDYNDLENKPDLSNFITNTVDNLLNYYKKSESYTKEEVNNIVSNIATLNIEVVESLPVENISTSTIYLLAKENNEESNIYDEYIYVSNNWEKVGDTKVDLSNYATKTYVDNKIGDIESLLAEV